MKEPKNFDCVQLKWDIQQKLLREIEELGEEEALKRRKERLINDPILGPFLRAKAAEDSKTHDRKAS